MNPQTVTQGTQAPGGGINNFDPNTGSKLLPGETVTVKPQNNLIVTGTQPAADFAKNSQYITNLISSKNTTPTTPTTDPSGNPITTQNTDPSQPNYSDSYTQMLDRISSTSDAATKNLIATIQANRQNQTNTINKDADRLKSGLMSLGLETGQINFTPDLVYGHIQQAENDRMAKLSDIDQKEATALLDAQQAADNKDFTLLKDRVDYIKSLKQDQIDVLKNTYETMNYQQEIGKIQATQIYDELQKLPNSSAKLSFLQGIASKYNIPLEALTSQVSAITKANAKSSSKSSPSTAFKTSQNIAKVTPLMEKIKGGDGYIDPQQWVNARTEWQTAGGTEASFKSNFLKYLNPISYKLAGYTPPKSTSGRQP